MTMNPIPPQAYTRETLAQAYNWLKSQPQNIQDMAKSPDILVSLYMKAQLHGESFLERPSLINFKNDLKHLAGIMGEFDTGNTAQIASTPKISGNASFGGTNNLNSGLSSNPHHEAPQATYDFKSSLDGRSLAMISDIKNQFNLSSETEALRMLVALGYQKLKSL